MTIFSNFEWVSYWNFVFKKGNKMENVKIEKDIKVFYVTASSFPEGIREAIDKLHSLFPFSKERNIFGLSRPENGGGIVYRAAADEMEKGEADRLVCETLIVKKGNYVSLTVNDFRKDPMAITKALEQLLALPNIDPQGYCLEWYETDKEAVKCMIRLDE